jgi:hypothetical protein
MAGKNPKIGFIARVDDTGLGVESLEFVEHIKPAKVLKVLIGDKPQHPERIAGIDCRGIPNKEVMEEFLKDIDVLFCIEMPYYPYTFSLCRKLGVKSILRVNYEYLDTWIGYNRPDLFISPVDWNLKYIPDPKIVLPFPVNTKKIKPREIRKARTFVHIAGNTGYMDRNGTNIVKQAIPLIKSRARVIIYNQSTNPVKNYYDLYKIGDVLLYPRRHSGQSLVVNEAQAAGMAIMMTDMEPQNKFLPKELLLPVFKMSYVDIKRRIEFATIRPEDVAKKVDEWYNQDIWEFSKQSLERAKSISWEMLLPTYRKIFASI